MLARLKGEPSPDELVAVPLRLNEEPLADVHRYDSLREVVDHVE